MYNFTFLKVRSPKWVFWDKSQRVSWAGGATRESISLSFSDSRESC